MSRSLTQDEFLERCRSIHGDRYDYAATVYVKLSQKITVICRDHGAFQQMAASHIHGAGCPACGGCLPLGTDAFIERARKLYGDRFGYAKVTYVNSETEVVVTCPRHGDFAVKPSRLLHFRKICPVCKAEEQRRRRRSFKSYLYCII
jgi:hypothetical protein